jgi:pre-mRNA-processing factor 40
MLGNPGSNPLEMFWDVVDTLDQKLDAKIDVVNEAILVHNTRIRNECEGAVSSDGNQVFSVSPETNEGDFMALVKEELRTLDKVMSDEDLCLVFETVRGRYLYN